MLLFQPSPWRRSKDEMAQSVTVDIIQTRDNLQVVVRALTALLQGSPPPPPDSIPATFVPIELTQSLPRTHSDDQRIPGPLVGPPFSADRLHGFFPSRVCSVLQSLVPPQPGCHVNLQKSAHGPDSLPPPPTTTASSQKHQTTQHSLPRIRARRQWGAGRRGVSFCLAADIDMHGVGPSKMALGCCEITNQDHLQQHLHPALAPRAGACISRGCRARKANSPGYI